MVIGGHGVVTRFYFGTLSIRCRVSSVMNIAELLFYVKIQESEI